MSTQSKRLLLNVASTASVFGILALIALGLLAYVVLLYVLIVVITVKLELQGVGRTAAIVVIIGLGFTIWQLKGLGLAKKAFGLLAKSGDYFDRKKAELDHKPSS